MTPAPSPSLELSLSGVVIRALRLCFATLGNAKAYCDTDSPLLDTDSSATKSILSGLGDLYNELEAAEPLSSIRHGSWRTLLEVATKMQRLVGDLIVHLEEFQQVGGNYEPSKELRRGLYSKWNEEDRLALERRLSGLRDAVVDEIIPALK